MNLELSSEDELRLQVLLVNAEAVRIDEQRMVGAGCPPNVSMKFN